MPNVEILRSLNDTALLRAIRDSNQQKIERDRQMEKDPDVAGARCQKRSRSSRHELTHRQAWCRR
jgi:hypothetical protein